MSGQEGWNEKSRDLLARMLRDSGCSEFGMMVASGHGKGCVPDIAHDHWGAPYVIDEAGCEVADSLVSFSDEGDVSACAWVKVTPYSPVVGLGVDLVDAVDFREAERGSFLVRALFNEDEVRLVRESHPKDVPVGYAFAFGAKEAAFKATSQPLRAWRQRHDGGLFFEVRDFALAADGLHAEGVRRAANVFPTLGIDRIRLGHASLSDLVLVVALAIGINET